MNPTSPATEEKMRAGFRTAWERADAAFPTGDDWIARLTQAVGPEEVLRFYKSKVLPINLAGIEWQRSCHLSCFRQCTRHDYELSIKLSYPFAWECNSKPCEQHGEFLDLCDRLKPASELSSPLTPIRLAAVRQDLRWMWCALHTTYQVFADPEIKSELQALFDRAIKTKLWARFYDEELRQDVFHHGLKWLANRLALQASTGVLPFKFEDKAFRDWLEEHAYGAVWAAAKRREVRNPIRGRGGDTNPADWPDLTSPETVQQSENTIRLWDAIAKLPPELEQVIRILLAEGGKTQRQVAGELGVSDATVHRRIKEALKHLRGPFGEESNGD